MTKEDKAPDPEPMDPERPEKVIRTIPPGLIRDGTLDQVNRRKKQREAEALATPKTESSRLSDIRESLDPFAGKLAKICDLLDVDPTKDGWLDECVGSLESIRDDFSDLCDELNVKTAEEVLEAVQVLFTRVQYAEQEKAGAYTDRERYRKRFDELEGKVGELTKEIVDWEKAFRRSESDRNYFKAVAEKKADELRDRAQITEAKLTVADSKEAAMELLTLKHRLEMIRRTTEGALDEYAVSDGGNLYGPSIVDRMFSPKADGSRVAERGEHDPGKVEHEAGFTVGTPPKRANLPPDPMRRVLQEAADRHPADRAALHRAGLDPMGGEWPAEEAFGPTKDAPDEVQAAAEKIAATQEANRKRLGELESRVVGGVDAFVERISKGGAVASLAGLADAVKPFQSSGGAQPSKPAEEPDVWAKGSVWKATGPSVPNVTKVEIIEVLDPGDNAERVRFSLDSAEFSLPSDEFTKAYEPVPPASDADDDDGMAAYLAQKFGQKKDNES